MRRGLTRELTQAFGAILILAGLIGASILILQGTENATEVAVAATGTTAGQATEAACRMREDRAQNEFGGGHPDKRWYAPTDQAPEQDLGHVIGDGYVIARYRKDLPATQIQQLRKKLDELGSSNIGAPAPDGQDEALVVTTARRVLRCSTPDLAVLQEFSTAWMNDVAAGRIQ